MNKDIQIASSIISSLLDESLIEVTPLIGKGSVNKIFIVETVSNKVVVTMSEMNEALDEYAKESWCIERAAARGVLVPSVLNVGRCAGNAFIVQSFIAGDEGRDSHVPRHVIWRELGRYELEGLLVLRAFDKLRWAIDWNVEELDRFVRHAREAVSRHLT